MEVSLELAAEMLMLGGVAKGRAESVEIVRAEQSGSVHELKAFAVGQASMLLAAGRRTAEGAVDPAAGIVLKHAVGDRVLTGDVLAELNFNPPHAAAPEVVAMFRGAVGIADEPADSQAALTAGRAGS